MKKQSLTLDISRIAVSLLGVITLFLFAPLEFFLSQPANFWFSVKDVFLLLLLETIIVFLFIYFLLFFTSKTKIYKYLFVLLFSLGLAFYLQGNWTFVRYGEMDGTPINWAAYKKWAVINSFLWVIIICIPFVVAYFKKKVKYLFTVISFSILAIEAITICTLVFTYNEDYNKTNFYFTKKDALCLSRDNHNILVVCADGFDACHFLPVFDKEPSLKQYFDGFTFFEDTVGTSLFSEEGGINLLTGNQFECGPSFKQNVSNMYNNCQFYKELEKNNYKLYLYVSDENMVSEDIAKKAENTHLGNYKFNKSRMIKITNKMVFFRYSPHVFKKYFWYSFSNFKGMKQGYSNLFWVNSNLHKKIISDGVSASMPSNCFQFFWIAGAHEPAYHDRYLNRLDNEAKKGDHKILRKEQIIGVVRLFTEIITALKDAGVYDNTTIIFTADHGWDIRPNPLLLIKKENSHGPLYVSEAPISMIEDWKGTLLYFITGEKRGNTVYDVPENIERNRPFYVYDINTNNRTYNNRETINYGTKPFKRLNFELNKLLSPDELDFLHVSGMSISEKTHIWNNGNEAVFEFQINEDFKDVQIYVNYFTFHGKKSVSIYANGKKLEEFIANGKEEKTFIIPGAFIDKKTGVLELKFIFPDAESPKQLGISEDNRILALGFLGMKISLK